MHHLITSNSVKNKFKYLLLTLMSIGLVACGNSQDDDLEQFMKNAASGMKPRIKRLPEVKPYLALQYNADNTLVDPFHARKATHQSSVLQPNLKRPKEAMESYPVESIKYVGMIAKNKLIFALLKTPDNAVQQVKIGNFVGQNYGLVSEINESEVVLKEIVLDDLSGDWVERVTKLALQG